MLSRRLGRCATGLAAAALVIAVATLVRLPQAAEVPSMAAAAENRPASRNPVWNQVPNAVPVFALTAPPAPLTRYEARLDPDTGAREDIASYGAAMAGFHLRVALVRAESAPPASHFVDLARRAAEAGLALVRLGRPEALATRFEALEVADAVLASAGSNATRACQSFRLHDAALGIALTGWMCDYAAPAEARAKLACVVDRLTLTPEAGDLALQAIFAAPSRALACPGLPVFTAAAEPGPEPGSGVRRKRGRSTAGRSARPSQG
jgi:hypothetical protein